MKQIILLACFLIFLGNSSCNKKDDVPISDGLPSWVKQRVEELTANGESCKFVDVLLFEVNEKKYYNIDFGYSDCAFCNVFDEKGRPVAQAEQANWGERKVIDMYPGCE